MSELRVTLGAAEADLKGGSVFANITPVPGVRNPGALCFLQPSDEAAKAGVEAGDEVLAIGGAPCENVAVPEFSRRFLQALEVVQGQGP